VRFGWEAKAWRLFWEGMVMKVRMREMRENDGALKRSLHLWLLRVAVNVLFSTCFMTCEPIALLSSFPTHQGTFRSQTCIQNTAPAILSRLSVRVSISCYLSLLGPPPLSLLTLSDLFQSTSTASNQSVAGPSSIPPLPPHLQ